MDANRRTGKDQSVHEDRSGIDRFIVRLRGELSARTTLGANVRAHYLESLQMCHNIGCRLQLNAAGCLLCHFVVHLARHVVPRVDGIVEPENRDV